MSIPCHICGSKAFQFARLRFRDLPRLLVLKYPMRCWVCRDRDYVTLLRILKIRREAPPKPRQRLSDDEVSSS
jgi:hypothetical protein